MKLLKNFSNEEENDVKGILDTINKNNDNKIDIFSFFTLCDVLFLRFESKKSVVKKENKISGKRKSLLSIFKKRQLKKIIYLFFYYLFLNFIYFYFFIFLFFYLFLF